MRGVDTQRAGQHAKPRTQLAAQLRRRHDLRGLARVGVSHAPIKLDAHVLVLDQRRSHSGCVHESGVQLAPSGGRQ